MERVMELSSSERRAATVEIDGFGGRVPTAPGRHVQDALHPAVLAGNRTAPETSVSALECPRFRGNQSARSALSGLAGRIGAHVSASSDEREELRREVKTLRLEVLK
jgi:hypothetical protein